MEIRTLNGDDITAYHPLRLQALREHPEAFSSDYEDELRRDAAEAAQRLQPSPDRFMLGAWVDGALVGVLGLNRSPGRKVRHRAGLGAMYVAPNFRRQGVGQALIAAVIQHARALPDLEELVLAVTVGNDPARRFYLAAGFVPSYVEPRYIKHDGRYFDIEWMSLRLVTR